MIYAFLFDNTLLKYPSVFHCSHFIHAAAHPRRNTGYPCPRQIYNPLNKLSKSLKRKKKKKLASPLNLPAVVAVVPGCGCKLVALSKNKLFQERQNQVLCLRNNYELERSSS